MRPKLTHWIHCNVILPVYIHQSITGTVFPNLFQLRTWLSPKSNKDQEPGPRPETKSYYYYYSLFSNSVFMTLLILWILYSWNTGTLLYRFIYRYMAFVKNLQTKNVIITILNWPEGWRWMWVLVRRSCLGLVWGGSQNLKTGFQSLTLWSPLKPRSVHSVPHSCTHEKWQ